MSSGGRRIRHRHIGLLVDLVLEDPDLVSYPIFRGLGVHCFEKGPERPRGVGADGNDQRLFGEGGEKPRHEELIVPVPGQERLIHILTGLDPDVLWRTWMSAQDEAFRLERLDDRLNCVFPQQVILAVQFDPDFVAEDVHDWYDLLDRLRVFVIRRRHC
ncbi:hypothetical protein PanWU01x14_242840 [Parasponia andersonii]|uniref:Uncharacterized protein n=1 Tax=Parasponia andersonii TaxID=3476 RepID=A0A2P5BFW0_PARAD|nr:hypothetical protein PanWU01x14_242840 [Parasponia andersonii]